MAVAIAPQLESFGGSPQGMQMAQAMPQAMPQPMIPSTAPQQETLPALQSIAPPERPPAEVNIVPPSFDLQQYVNKTDTIPSMPKAAKVPGRMKFMATMSALVNRDFGPMMQLMQQERKADFWNKFTTVMPEINSLTRQGKHNEANKVLQAAIAELGSANPEVAALMQPLQAKIFEQEKVQEFVKQTTAKLKLDYARLPEAEREAKKEEHKATLDVVEGGRLMADSTQLKEYIRINLERTSQPDVANNATNVVDPFGNITSVPNVQRPVRGDIPDWAMQTLSGATGLRPDMILNALRDEKSELNPILTKMLTRTLEVEAQKKLVKDVGVDPATVQMRRLDLARKGYTPEQINLIMASGGSAVEVFGAQSAQDKKNMAGTYEDTRTLLLEEQARASRAMMEAEGDVPLYQTKVTQQGHTIVGTEASGAHYGMRQPNMTTNQAKASNGKYAVLTHEQAKHAEKVIDAIAQVNKVQDMFVFRGSPEGDWWRNISGLTQTGKEFFGTDDIAAAKASALAPLVAGGIEILENEMKLPSSQLATAKRVITSNTAGMNAGVAAVGEIVKISKERINRYMNQSSESVLQPLQTPQERRRTEAENAPSTQDLRRAAGVGTTAEAIKQGKPLSLSVLQPMFAKTAAQYNLPASLLQAVAQVESGYKPGAVSSQGAQGIMQFMPETAKHYKLANPFDPQTSIDATARYLTDLLKTFNGNMQQALTAYHSGEENVRTGNLGPKGKAYAPAVLAAQQKIQQSTAFKAQIEAQGNTVLPDGDVSYDSEAK